MKTVVTIVQISICDPFFLFHVLFLTHAGLEYLAFLQIRVRSFGEVSNETLIELFKQVCKTKCTKIKVVFFQLAFDYNLHVEKKYMFFFSFHLGFQRPNSKRNHQHNRCEKNSKADRFQIEACVHRGHACNEAIQRVDGIFLKTVNGMYILYFAHLKKFTLYFTVNNQYFPNLLYSRS